jgi:redox-sensitive bicupin YhaK (pirin superfamily)
MIELVIDQRRHNIGAFEVGRVLPFAKRRMVGPFIFFDHMGPADFRAGLPREVDVRPHPHIGLATVTYLFAGEIMHRDSVGSQQAIRPGEVNWMVAGSGITHSERFEKARAEGDHLNGIQTWVALPDDLEETAPAFFHHGTADLPCFEDHGLRGRIVAGTAFGMTARVAIQSPLFYLHFDLDAGARAALPAEYSERAAYVAAGAIEVAHRRFEAGQMLVLTPGETVSFTASEAATVILIGGEPVGERFIEWNFVASSKQRLAQAVADWRTQRMKLPDFDHDEFIPY